MKVTLYPKLIIPAALFILTLQTVDAQQVRFGTVPTPIAITYDLNNGNTVTETVEVQHRQAATAYYVAFNRETSWNSYTPRRLFNGTHTLNFYIYDNMTNKNVLKSRADSTSASNVVSGNFTTNGGTTWPGQSQYPTYTIYIPPNQLVLAGTYSTTFAMRLFLGAWNSSTAGTSPNNVSVTINCTVPPVTDICLVATGGAFNPSALTYLMDFGTLNSAGGQSLNCDFIARANTAMHVTLQSSHSGVMAHPTAPDTIGYIFKFNGSSVNLSGGAVTILTPTVPTAIDGVRNTVQVVTQPFVFPAEGTYSDTLTFTIVVP